MERFQYLVVVNVLLRKDDKVLLARRFNTGFCDGEYELPSGHADGGETVREAAVREMKEEIGVFIDVKDLQVTHVMHRKGKKERIEFYIQATKWEGEPSIQEPDKCDDMQWFQIDALPDNMVEKSRSGLESLLKGDRYSEFGWD